MKTIKSISFLLAISLLAFGCLNSKKANDYVTLRQAWFPWAGYLGELVAVHETDTINGLNLKIEAGADDIDPVKLVIGGNNDFGVASAETVIDAINKGASLKIIGIINYKSPTCFISLDTTVKKFSDFDRKTVGILTATETETIYRLLLKRGIIDKNKIKEVEIPFDLNSFILTKSYDIRPAYIYDEPITLDSKNISYSIIKPESYNVSIISGVYFTTDKMISTKPKIVQEFVNSIALGWEMAILNPNKAVDYLSEYDSNIDKVRELKSFIKGIDYFKGEDGKSLWASEKTILETLKILMEMGKIENAKDINKYFNTSFINNYHKLKSEN